MSSSTEDVVGEPVGPAHVGHRRPTAAEALDGRRPTLTGDLRGLLSCGPVFRRAVGGYDRFQVDTYVRWAEDELTGAARLREELLTRLVHLSGELDEARRQLARSAGVREALRLVPRIGWVLAAAADQADEMRAEADADRGTAAAEAERILAEASAEAERVVSAATSEAAGVLEEAREEAGRLAAAADALLSEAERAAAGARAEVGRRQEELAGMQRRADEDAERARQAASRDAGAARLQARDDVLRLLTEGREQRRRADAEAAAARDALDRAAAERVAALRAEAAVLEQQLAVGNPAAPRPRSRLGTHPVP